MGLPQYIKNAQNAYNSRMDIIQVKFRAGIKNRIKAVTGDSVSMAEYCRRAILVALENDEEELLYASQQPAPEPQEEVLSNSLPESESPLQGQEWSVEMVQAMLDAKKAEQDRQAEELRQIHAAAEIERLEKMKNPEYAATFAEMDKIALEEKERKRAETLTMARIQSNQY